MKASPTMFSSTRLRCRYFSLLELLIAMSVLSIIIVMLLMIMNSSNRQFRYQEGRTRIYQNSRVVMDVLDRDFRTMVTSNITGQEVKYHVFPHDKTDHTKAEILCFVATIEPHDAATSKMCEIVYRFHLSNDEPARKYKLQRLQVSNRKFDTDGSAVDNTDWDFFGAPATAGNEWYINSANADDYETVTDGVSEFTIELYDIQGNLIDPGASGISSGLFPNRAVINLVLFDPSLTEIENTTQAEALRIRTKRAFTKIIYLGNINK